GHLTPENPLYLDQLGALTAALTPQLGASASEQATALIYQTLQRQAMLLAYIDNFRLIALVCLLCVPLVFLFRRVRARPDAAAAAETAAADARRAEQLFARQLIARQALDAALATARMRAADAEAARKRAAEAALKVEYTRLTAPEAGRVTHRTVEEGAYVQVGQALMTIVPNDFWVIANFKETQLTNV